MAIIKYTGRRSNISHGSVVTRLRCGESLVAAYCKFLRHCDCERILKIDQNDQYIMTLCEKSFLTHSVDDFAYK